MIRENAKWQDEDRSRNVEAVIEKVHKLFEASGQLREAFQQHSDQVDAKLQESFGIASPRKSGNSLVSGLQDEDQLDSVPDAFWLGLTDKFKSLLSETQKVGEKLSQVQAEVDVMFNA